MTRIWSNETPEHREARLAEVACMKADVIFRGVRDGLCYFEVYFDDEVDGRRAVLSLPTEGLTPEKISNHAAEADGSGIEQRRLREQREES